MQIDKVRASIAPYEGVLRFAIVLFAANIFWKLSFSGDDNSAVVTFWGMDCSGIFDFAIYHIAEVSWKILHFFGYPVSLYETNLNHANGNGVVVIWGCSGLKQSFIFLCIMLFSRGAIKHKLWYSSLGLFVVYLVNLSRIVLLTMLVYNYSEYFELVHDYMFKYFFYFVIFMIWVLWEEVLVKRLS